MQEHSLKKQVENLRPLVGQEEEAKLAILYNALVTNINAYRSDSSASALKNWQSAESALADCLSHLEDKYQPATPTSTSIHPDTFATQQEVLTYLKAAGYKIEKSALSNHVRSRLLIKKAGVYRRKDVDNYSGLHLQSGATGQTMADKKTADLQERKLRAEIGRTEEQYKRAIIEREALEGKLIPRDEVELELAGRAVALEAGYDHMVYTMAAGLVELVDGNQAKVDRLITTMLEAKNEWLNQYAGAVDFVVILKKDA
jgi:hypothetical protein